MPANQTGYPEVSFTSTTSGAVKVPNGIILMNNTLDQLTYTPTTSNLTVSSIIDLNARTFTFITLTVKIVQVGNLVSIRVFSNQTGTSGSANKYEITLPTLPSPPTIIRGVGTVYDSTNTSSIDPVGCLIYNSNKMRVFNQNLTNMNVSGSTNDYSYTLGRTTFTNAFFTYTI
jgi:hypothetical protein